MKRILQRFIPALLLALPNTLSAQGPYWGMTSGGGTSGIGTIYNVTEAGVYTKAYDFFRYEGGSPKGEVVKASNGLYYGVTQFGGTNGVGVLYSFNPTTSAYTVLANFSTATSGAAAIGAEPTRGLLYVSSNNRVYGTCPEGGANNLGTLWSYAIGTSTFTKHRDFDNLTGSMRSGSTPRGRLMQASNSVIYGTTQFGGLNGRGVIFSLTTAGAFTRLYDFAALPGTATGTQPYSGLVQPVAGGLLYGTTQIGGANGMGVIYSFNISGPVYTSVYDLTSLGGSAPLAEMIVAPNGLLYGTTTSGGTSGGGVIFSYDAAGDAYVKRKDLNSATGYSPFSRMLVGSDGLLYGTADLGGTNSAGVIYSYNTATNVHNIVYNMADGGFADPWAGLIEDPAGTLVSVANDGGSGNEGALFKYVIGTGVETELVPFAFSNGSNPKGRLLKASNGMFYGLTNTGGSNNTGILFSFNPVGSVFTRLANFSSTLGEFPLGGMVEVSGKLYGVCSSGGAADGGSIFEYTIASNTLVKKIDLINTSSGTNPKNGLFKASNGKLYGNTSLGAANNLGAAFEYVIASNTVTKIQDFSAANGSEPLSDPIQASNGLLYGTCSEAGTFENGTLYSINPTNNAYLTLYHFNELEGGHPSGELLQATNGKLYGTFREGGQGFTGGVFSWTISPGTYTEEYDFNIAPITTEGKFPGSNLVQGADGLIYGTCVQGGTNDLGNVFRFNPTSLAMTTLQSFTGTNGQYSFDGLVNETVTVPTNVGLNAKVFLEGPYDSGTGKMTATLRTVAGFPTTEPFTAAGFTIVGGGGETINPSVLTTTGDNAVEDWILIELRDDANNTVIQRTQAALLQSDGDIVALDNVSPLTISMPADNYFVAIRHRNHFSVMTSAAVALSASATTLNFTNGTVATYGTNAQKLIGAVRVNWAGNVVRNNQIRYTGLNNDRDPILVRVGSSNPTNTVTGYWSEDVTLNGTVSYTGSGNDRDPILVNVGGSTPNNTLTEQLP